MLPLLALILAPSAASAPLARPLAIRALPAAALSASAVAASASFSPAALSPLAAEAVAVPSAPRPASFDEVPELDARYAAPESRARTAMIMGASQTVATHARARAQAAMLARELIRRGYNVLSAGGDAGVLGAAFNAAARERERGGRGENLIALTRPAWGDENLADGRAISVADGELDRVAKVPKLADSFVIFPGSAGTLQEAAALVFNNRYPGKAGRKRVFLVGREFFAPLEEQYRRLHADGLLPEPPERYFTLVDDVDAPLAALPAR